MQTSVPELIDVRDESAATLDAYGPEVRKPGSYAANCLLARRLLERDVRFVQLYHRGWDQHIAIRRQLPNQCRDYRSTDARARKRPQAIGHARRYIGRLRDRIRSHPSSVKENLTIREWAATTTVEALPYG